MDPNMQAAVFRLLVVVNTLLLAAVVALVVLVESDPENVRVASAVMAVLSGVPGLLLPYYAYKVGQVASTKTARTEKRVNTPQRLGLLLGVLFCGQAACWAVAADPSSSSQDLLPATLVLSHVLCSAALGVLLLVYHRAAANLLREPMEGRTHTTTHTHAHTRTRTL
jgi:hypothetical protein